MELPLRSFLLATLAAAALGGCATSTTVEIEDSGAFLAGARISLPLSRQTLAPSRPQGGHAVEIGLTTTGGSDRQSLAAGALPIMIGGQQFNGPLVLQYQFDYTHFDARYRFRKFFGAQRSFGIEALAGVGIAQFDLDASAPGQRARHSEDAAGLSGGVGAILNILPSTSLQLRLGGYLSDTISATRAELFMAQALGRHAAVRGGFATWRVQVEPSGSKIHASFSGPALGLDVMF